MTPILFALATSAAILSSAAAFAAEKTARIEVTGLYCASCPYIAAQAITAIKSAKITDGYYDPEKQMAQFVVKYDDAVTTPEALANATVEYGYPAKLIKKIKGES